MLTTRSVNVDVDLEQSAIHAACQSGNLQDIQAALLGGEKAVNSFYDGYTPLHTTVVNRKTQACDVIHTLLEHGADINAQTRGDEDTALHLVVEKGDFPRDFSLILMLLENNVDLSVRNRKLRTAYDCAMGKGHFELASTLDGSMPPEQARRFYMEKIGEKYGPMIITAVLRSNRAQLEESLRLGGNPNMLNQHGAGAIHYAITHCTLPVMEVLTALVEAEADVNLRDDEGDTALNLAIKSKRLRETGEMIPVVTYLVNHGADSSFKDLDGKDAVQMAEERGYDDVLDVLRAPKQRPQPLPKAEESFQPKDEPETETEPVSELPEPAAEEESCAEPESESPDAAEESCAEPESESPDAAEQGEEFPDPNAPNAEGLYPIHVATLRENPTKRHDLIESLIERGAKVSQATQEEGNTALHLCAQRNLGDSAEQLLKHHIDYTVRNKEGKTAYELAEELEHMAVMAAIEAKEKEVQDRWKKAKKAGLCAIL